MKKLVKFYSKTCGPCKVLDKNLKAAEVEYDSVEINNPDNDVLRYKYDIRTIPTLVLLDEDNNMIKKNTGILNVEQIKHFIGE